MAHVCRSLARDNKHAIEKEQALKLIRSFVEIGSDAAVPSRTAGSGTIPVSEAVMRAVIAIAEHPEDPFKNICIQTLIEIRQSPATRVHMQQLTEAALQSSWISISLHAPVASERCCTFLLTDFPTLPLC
jgi:hypothetical protein